MHSIESRTPAEEKLLMHFGDRVLQRRRLHGWTQEQLAAHSGFSGRTISYYELGKRAPTIICLVRLANALECSTSFLLHGKD